MTQKKNRHSIQSVLRRRVATGCVHVCIQQLAWEVLLLLCIGNVDDVVLISRETHIYICAHIHVHVYGDMIM